MPKFIKIITVTLILNAAAAFGSDVEVKGYYRSDGTYVQPHYRSNPDDLYNNNWTTKGNINPYTGQLGTRDQMDESYFDSAPVFDHTTKMESTVSIKRTPTGGRSYNSSSYDTNSQEIPSESFIKKHKKIISAIAFIYSFLLCLLLIIDFFAFFKKDPKAFSGAFAWYVCSPSILAATWALIVTS